MGLTPESSYQDHHIHPWHCSTDDREWLDTGTREGDQVVPVAEYGDELSDPRDPVLDPARPHQWDHEKNEWEEGEEYGDDFRKAYEKLFDDFHELIVRKKILFAKEILNISFPYLVSQNLICWELLIYSENFFLS